MIAFSDEPLNYYCDCWLALVHVRSQVWSLKVGAGSWDRVLLGERLETVHENYPEVLLPCG